MIRVVLVAFLFIAGLSWALAASAHQGSQTRRAIAACHARGAEFHYWQDRRRCVRYVDGR